MQDPCAQGDLHDIQASLAGDNEAYARLVNRYQAQVFSQMWRFTRDRAVQDELAQDVFIEVYRSLKGFRAEAPLLHWIRRIATRVGYRYWRSKARERQMQENLWKTLPDPEQQSPEEAAESLHLLLVQLHPKERLILTLQYFEGCEVEEIADRTGWSANLVRVRAHRARQKLRKLLEDAGYGRKEHG